MYNEWDLFTVFPSQEIKGCLYSVCMTNDTTIYEKVIILYKIGSFSFLHLLQLID